MDFLNVFPEFLNFPLIQRRFRNSSMLTFHFMRTETSSLQSPLWPVTLFALLFNIPHGVLHLVFCCPQKMCRNTIFKRVQLTAYSLTGENHLKDDVTNNKGDGRIFKPALFHKEIKDRKPPVSVNGTKPVQCHTSTFVHFIQSGGLCDYIKVGQTDTFAY